MERTSTATKQQIYDQLHVLLGLPAVPLGPGSKERRRSFEVAARLIGLDPDAYRSKTSLLEALFGALGAQWDDSCHSTGDTVTRLGISRLVSALEEWRVASRPRRERMERTHMADLEMDMDEDNRSQIERALAECLAELSEAETTPDEFDPPPAAFAADEVDFRSNGWMSSVAAVQGWLRLPETLELSEPAVFVRSLVMSLGFSDLDVPTAGDGTRLADVALDRLRDRAEQALKLKESFEQDLEIDDVTTASATARWKEAWDDDPGEDQSTGPVSATADIWRISDFSYKATRGFLNLSPSYQRGDVWPTKDSQMLIESILRGIPLPSVIILKPDHAAARYEVVDGKQRLTAILRFMGRHPAALERVDEADERHPDYDLRGLFERDYPKFRRLWRNLEGEQLTASIEREYYFPFRLRTDSPALDEELRALEGRYYTEIKDQTVRIADGFVAIQDIFEQASDYKIPVIEYQKATRRQIHEVFNLYNKQGKHLNAEEIRNALYHDLKLMRALIVAAGDNRDVEVVAPFLLPIWDDLVELEGLLDDYRFGTSRYRRTKVLSWLAAMLLFDSLENGRPRRRSTAMQINDFLQRVEEDASDPMRDSDRIRDAFSLIYLGVQAHSAVDEAWEPRFKDTKQGAKWQELQLIASLLGVCFAAAVLGEDVERRLSDIAEDLREQSGGKEFARPAKTQTATQWDYVARVAIRTARVLELDLEEVDETLRDRFGYSGVGALRVISGDVRDS